MADLSKLDNLVQKSGIFTTFKVEINELGKVSNF